MENQQEREKSIRSEYSGKTYDELSAEVNTLGASLLYHALNQVYYAFDDKFADARNGVIRGLGEKIEILEKMLNECEST